VCVSGFIWAVWVLVTKSKSFGWKPFGRVVIGSLSEADGRGYKLRRQIISSTLLGSDTNSNILSGYKPNEIGIVLSLASVLHAV